LTEGLFLFPNSRKQ